MEKYFNRQIKLWGLETQQSLQAKHIVIVGCGEMRGMGMQYTHTGAPNAIREQFYKLYYYLFF